MTGRFWTCVGLACGLALALPAARAQLESPQNPSALECASVFSVLVVDARQAGSPGSERERSALRLYSNALRRSVLEGEFQTLAAARKAAGDQSALVVKLLDSEAGTDRFAIAAEACIARHG